MPAGRATLAGTVTVAVWSVRVLARVLAVIAGVLGDVADLADRARGRTGTPATAAAPPAQSRLIP